MRTITALLLFAAALLAADTARRAPGFALPDTRGEIQDLYDYRGKPVILNFMQSNCPHCATFVSALQKVQAKYGKSVAILAVVDPPDTPQTVAAFVEGHKITYPVLFDCGQVAYSYVRSQKMEFPQVYLIDANGMIYGQYAYSVFNRDFFEGNALLYELERMMTKK